MAKTDWGRAFLQVAEERKPRQYLTDYVREVMGHQWHKKNGNQYDSITRHWFKLFCIMVCMDESRDGIGVPEDMHFDFNAKVLPEDYLNDFEGTKRKQLVYDNEDVAQ